MVARSNQRKMGKGLGKVAERLARRANLLSIKTDVIAVQEQLEVQSWIDPFPAAGQECIRLQQIKRGEVVLVRARSRWYCQMQV